MFLYRTKEHTVVVFALFLSIHERCGHVALMNHNECADVGRNAFLVRSFGERSE